MTYLRHFWLALLFVVTSMAAQAAQTAPTDRMESGLMAEAGNPVVNSTFVENGTLIGSPKYKVNSFTDGAVTAGTSEYETNENYRGPSLENDPTPRNWRPGTSSPGNPGPVVSPTVVPVLAEECLVNGSFELPALGGFGQPQIDTVPGWKTVKFTLMEYWPAAWVAPAPDGNQLIELYSNGQETIYQDFQTTPGDKLTYSFYHRQRDSAQELAAVAFGSPGATTVVGNTQGSTSNAWTKFMGEYTVPAGQTVTRFEIQGVTASVNYGGTGGNLIDAVSVQGTACPPLAVNKAPVITGDLALVVNKGASVVLTTTDLDESDPDDDATGLTYSVTSGPSNGSIQVSGVNANSFTQAQLEAGNVTYLHNGGASTTDSFALSLADGGEGGVAPATATMNVAITAVNDEPSFTKGADVTVNEDSGAYSAAWATGISKGPADESGQALTFHVTNGNNGLFSAQPAIAADGTLTFTPAANQNGSTTVTVYLKDDGGTANGGDDQSDNQQFTITLSAVNDAPSFTLNGDVTVLEDSGPYSQTGFASKISAGQGETQALSFSTLVSGPLSFESDPAISSDGTLTFTPSAGTSGTVTIVVWLSDDGGTDNKGVDSSSNKTFVVTVTDVNDAPVLTLPTGITVDEDATVNITGISVADEDGATQTFTVTMSATSTVTIPTGGISITSGANGTNALSFSGGLSAINAALASVTYAPSPNQTSGASVTITVTDSGTPAASASGTIDITVNAVNDVPVAMNDTATVPQSGTVVIRVLDNDTDLESQTLTIQSVTTPNSGTARFTTNGTIEYVASATFEGVDRFSYTIIDAGGAAATAEVAVTVTGPGPDGDGVTSSIEDGAANNGDGDNDGTRDSQQNNVASLPITTGDNQGQYITVAANTNLGLQQVTSTDIPDPTNAPANAQFPVGRVSFKVANLNVGQRTVINIYLPRGVKVTSYYKYGPTKDDETPHWYPFFYDGMVGAKIIEETATDPPRILLYLQDGELGDADLTRNGIIDDPGVPVFTTNQLPVALADVATLAEDTSVTLDVLGNDTDGDGDALSIIDVTQSSGGTATVNTDGTITYTANANYNGSDSFIYTVGDGNGAPVEAKVNLTITAVEDAPLAEDDSATTEEETKVIVPFMSNDSDADGDNIYLVAIDNPMHGTAVYNADRTLTYIPNAGFFGTDSFFYDISDGKAQARATVTVTVTNTPDQPLGIEDAVTTEEDTSISISVLNNDTDPDAGTLSITSFTQPANGSVTQDGASLVFTPAENYYGSDSFTYTMSNASLQSAATSVTLTVTAVNDVPMFETTPVFTSPAEGEQIFIGGLASPGDPALSVTFSFEAATDVEDSSLSYVWELSLDEGFTFVVAIVESSETNTTLTHEELIALVQASGFELTTERTLYHRATATDSEGAKATSDASSFMIIRGLTTDTGEHRGVPTEYFLSENYPNPFNPSTTIEFGLPEAAHVTITLYDLSGRQVQLVTDRQLAPGVHRERIEMGTLPSGAYIYTLVTSERQITKVMHLVK